jgi:hypothetical protein
MRTGKICSRQRLGDGGCGMRPVRDKVMIAADSDINRTIDPITFHETTQDCRGLSPLDGAIKQRGTLFTGPLLRSSQLTNRGCRTGLYVSSTWDQQDEQHEDDKEHHCPTRETAEYSIVHHKSPPHPAYHMNPGTRANRLMDLSRCQRHKKRHPPKRVMVRSQD